MYVVCRPLPMLFFCVNGLVQSVTCPRTGAERHLSMDWCGASLVHGMEQSVTRPWTGAERHLSMDWCGASFVHGLVQSVTRPWTGAEHPSPSRGALKTGWCSKMDASPHPPLVRRVAPPWTGAERPLSMDWCGASLALAWSPKNREVFRIGRVNKYAEKSSKLSFATSFSTKKNPA